MCVHQEQGYGGTESRSAEKVEAPGFLRAGHNHLQEAAWSAGFHFQTRFFKAIWLYWHQIFERISSWTITVLFPTRKQATPPLECIVGRGVTMAMELDLASVMLNL